MLASFLGTKILDGFLKNKGSSRVDFGIDNIYLGLLTTLPQNNEKAYTDGSFFKEPSDEYYHRIKLNDVNPFSEDVYMQGAQPGEKIEVSDGVWALPAYVTNQAIIMFEESTTDWGKVVGFGIFKEESGGNLPIIWGAITAEDGESAVTVGRHEIPIIRVNGFKVSLV